MVTATMKLKKKKGRKKEKLAYWKKIYDQPRQHIKKKRHCFADKVPSNQSNVFSVNMYRCENWSPRKLSTEELMLLSCGVGEDFQESLGLQDQISQP